MSLQGVATCTPTLTPGDVRSLSVGCVNLCLHVTRFASASIDQALQRVRIDEKVSWWNSSEAASIVQNRMGDIPRAAAKPAPELCSGNPIVDLRRTAYPVSEAKNRRGGTCLGYCLMAGDR